MFHPTLLQGSAAIFELFLQRLCSRLSQLAIGAFARALALKQFTPLTDA
ncbi:hypothetical protein [Paenibacillus taichungensis]